ncbi:MAG: hypothetical protein RR190_02650 [Bacteroidales bacterium]
MNGRFMYLKIKLILVLFAATFFLNTQQVYATRPSMYQKFKPLNVFKNNTLSFAVYPLIYNGLSVQYERHLAGKHWLKLAPIYYRTLGYSTLRKTDFQYMQGFDISLYHVYDYYRNENKKFKLSLQYGVLYGQNDITTVSQTHTQIEKYGIDLMLSVRKMLGENFFFDFYIGYGNRWTSKNIENASLKSDGKYDDFMFDYGYSGPIFDIGINIGLAF